DVVAERDLDGVAVDLGDVLGFQRAWIVASARARDARGRRDRAPLIAAWARVRGRRGRVSSARHDGNATERRADEGGDEQESVGAVHRGSPFWGMLWRPS